MFVSGLVIHSFLIIVFHFVIWFSWQIELAKILLENGQSHLFQQWPELGVDDKEKLAFFDQVFSLCFFSYISVF